MISNYSEMIDSIVDELSGREDIADKVPEWIRMAEIAIAREIGMLDGEQVVTGTVAASNPQLQMPVGAKRPILVQFGTVPDLKTLEIVSFQALTAVLNNDQGTTPRAVAFVGRNGFLAPAAATGTTYTLVYYGLPPFLSETNPTNDLIEMAPDALKFQALVFSAPYLGDDERLQTWGSLLSAALSTLKREYWLAKTSGGVLRVRNDAIGGDGHWRPR